jgi:exodeoxyribonuclease VII large subunit
VEYISGKVDRDVKGDYANRVSQLPLFQTPFWSVTELTRYVRELIESDANLQDVWVQGEVSNFSKPASGHLYFTLKDSGSALRCVMWRNAVARQVFLPRDGQAVEVHGSLGVYENAGQYQLYVDVMRPSGEGALYQEFLRLKSRLEAEGLFAAERKRPLPRWPHQIGIITSPSGAALRDMLNTLSRRYPLARVILAPTTVQGSEAPEGIVAALRDLNQSIQPDVILLARGGGSIEDLWAFNDERVARAIAASVAPVISGIGHETDFTIADFVSDLRAPTPTAAAELAVPDQVDLHQEQAELRRRLGRAVSSRLREARRDVAHMMSGLRRYSPRGRIRSEKQHLDELIHQAERGLVQKLRLEQAHLDSLAQRLMALNPLEVLRRGYAMVYDEKGALLRDTRQAQAGDTLRIQLHDGSLSAQVKSVEPGKDEPRS